MWFGQCLYFAFLSYVNDSLSQIVMTQYTVNDKIDADEAEEIVKEFSHDNNNNNNMCTIFMDSA